MKTKSIKGTSPGEISHVLNHLYRLFSYGEFVKSKEVNMNFIITHVA